MNILKETIEKIYKDLNSINFINNLTIKPEFRINNRFIVDIYITYNYKSTNQEIIIETKNNGEIRYIKDMVNQIQIYKKSRPKAYYMVAAPFISPQSIKYCEKFNIGYIDLSGKLFINNDPLYIRLDENREITKRSQHLKSLFSPKAERMLRVLLDSGPRKWKTESLADEAKISIGYVAKIKKYLVDKEWMISEYGGFQLIKPFELLDLWKDNYDFSKNKVARYYSLSSISELEQKLNTYLANSPVDYAFTGQTANARYSPMVRYRKTWVYIQEPFDENQIQKDLSIKKVESRENILFIYPYDTGVFFNSKIVNGIRAASKIQIYLDLMSDKARGEESALTLFKDFIMPCWKIIN